MVARNCGELSRHASRSEIQKREEESTSSSVASAQQQAIAEILRDYGVDAGRPDQRLRRARELYGVGLTADDVRLVAEHVEANTREPKQAPRYLAWYVTDAKRMSEAVADLRAAEAKRAERLAQRGTTNVATHTNGVPHPWPTCRCPECVRQAREGRPWPASVTPSMVEAGVAIGAAASARSAS